MAGTALFSSPPTPFVDEVRDMLTHEDEDLTGGGWYAADYRKPITDGPLQGTAHSLVACRDDDYLLCGRVSGPSTMAALRDIAPVLSELCKRHPRPEQ
jgi:hypothetical protein